MKAILRNIVAITVTAIALNSANAQVFDYRLKMADSLYAKKQYTQSLDIYRDIFRQKTYSPAMLLRMAYIEEGLGQNSMALYYINMYYELTHDESALVKMEDMATRFNFAGYEANKTDRALAVIAENKNAIITALAGICIMLFALMIYTLKSRKIRPEISFSFFILTALLLIAFVNRDLAPRNGIVQNAPAYLMDGPSPGSNVVGIINEGNRLAVSGRKDVWVKVKWRDGYAYVKENQLLEVKLN